MNKFVAVVFLACSMIASAQTPSKPAVKMGGPAVQVQKVQAPVDPVVSLQAQVRVLRAQVQ